MAAITLTNLANYVFGIPTDETAINIQKLTIKAATQKIEVKDRVGHIVGRVDHMLKQEYTIEGFVSGTTGALASTVGAILTVAGAVVLGGISSTGACILDDIQTDNESGALAKVTYHLTRYDTIAAAATQVLV
jgi:hypothetical protein